MPSKKEKEQSVLTTRRHAQRKFADDCLANLQALVDARDPESLTKVRTELKLLQAYAATLLDLDEQIAIAIDDEEERQTDVEESTDFQGKFARPIMMAEILIEDLTTKPPSTPTTPGAANSSAMGSGPAASKRANLPKLKITAFDGSPLKWQEFWDAFESTVDSDPGLTAADKFQYLKEFLKGNALLLAEGYRMTEANYATVVDVLKQRYGDKEVAIQAHFDALLSMPAATGDISDLQRVFDKCEVHIRSLVALELDEVTFGRVFAPIMKSKLPEHIRLELERRHDGTPWTLESLRQLLRNELHARRMSKQVIGQGSPSPRPNYQSGVKSKGFYGDGKGRFQGKPPTTASGLIASTGATGYKRTPFKSCFFCKQPGHFSESCEEFPDLDSRKQVLKGCCFLCLKPNHRMRDCQSGETTCVHCKAQNKHNRSICPKKFGKPMQDSALNIDASEFFPQAYSFVGTAAATRSRRGLAIMQTALGTVKGTKGTLQVRLLFDPASARSFGRVDVLRRIGAKQVSTETLAVAGLGSERRSKAEYGISDLDLILKDGTEFPITVNSVKSISCPIQKHPISTDKFPILNQVQLADPITERSQTVQIDLLIGLDLYYSLVGLELCRHGTLVILDTKLGYIASGCVPAESAVKQVSQDTVMIVSTQSLDQELRDMLESLWNMESIGISDEPKLTDDQLAQQLFNKTVRYDSGLSRYEVRWPFKPGHRDLPTNYGLAYGRLVSLMRRLKREPETLRKYHETIMDQVKKGVVEEAPAIPDGKLVHYLPHHCVIKPDKVTKLRIVYDASAKARKDAVSLNECLLRGPVYLADLCGLIMRLRRQPIGVISDIEKAFLQVSLHRSDRDVTRFLWLKDPTKDVTADNLLIMRFDRVLFGIISSPFLLAATIRHHLAMVDTPVSRDILANNYVDNVITGCSTVAGAIGYYTEAKQVFSEISMNLREWYSNSHEFLNHVAEPDRGNATKVTVLGLPWDLKSDTLGCTTKARKNETEIQATKRSVLRTTASVFDPCGYFTPISLRGKLLLQSLWKLRCDWDDPIPDEQQKEWEQCLQNLYQIPEVRFPRFQGTLAGSVCELHVFCDAARPAYGAVAYLRVRENNQVRCDMIFAKSRVSPVKGQALTIPKLELTSMVVGCRMATFVSAQFVVSKKFIWCDNQCALHWVLGNESNQVYVRNRVKQIKDMGEWTFRHVPGQENPADLLTRGTVTVSQLRNNSLWWNGPVWLVKDPENWPVMPEILEYEEDAEPVAEVDVLLDHSDLPTSAKFPLALTKDSPINRALIKDVHEKLMHSGTPHVLAELRQEFWIINARSQVKQVRAKCQVCRREKGGPFPTPPAASLPNFRATQGECFSRVGIDYLGPLIIRQGKGNVKSWICLFTCAVTRAIHLEVIPDMTAEHFLLALRRFMALYGKPDMIVCDNAKTFHASNQVLNRVFGETILHDLVQGYTSSRGVDWKFVVELAPWMGGFYERMVALAKDRLRCTVQRKLLSFVELQTVCAEVSSILNSRPLTYCDDEVGTEVLTPNHFIIHTRPTYPQADPDDGGDPDYQPGRGSGRQSEIVGKWKRIQAMIDQFWKMWHRQYLVSLRERHWLPHNRGASTTIPKMSVFVIRPRHPMSRFHCFTRKLMYSGPRGPLYLSSLEHAFTYAILVQTGKSETAEILATEPSTEWDAIHVESWAKSNGLEMTADLLVNSQKIFEDLAMGQMDSDITPDRDDYCDMLRFYEKTAMSDPKTDNLVVCCGNRESIFSCGLKEADARDLLQRSENPFFPGAHIWSKIMRSILDIHLEISKGYFHFNPPLKFLREPIKFEPSHSKSILLVSNSLFRYMKDIELGTFHILKSATFESIVNFIHARQLNFVDNHFVVLQAGVVECDQGPHAERASLKSLEGLLDSVTKEPNCPQILICPTFLYYDTHQSTEGFARWLAKHLQRFAPLVRVVDWVSSPNPFFVGRQRVESLFDGDLTHTNLLGSQHLWRTCIDHLPELGLVPVEWHKTPYGEPRKRDVASASSFGRDVTFSYDPPPPKVNKVDNERVRVRIKR